jgi:hypothetical protein
MPEVTPIIDAELMELERLYEAASLSDLSSTHIINDGYTHLANLTTAPDKPCFVVMNRKEVMDWLAAAHNAFPAMVARIEELEDDLKAALTDRAELRQYLIDAQQTIAAQSAKIEELKDRPSVRQIMNDIRGLVVYPRINSKEQSK